MMQGEQVELEIYRPKDGDWAGNVDLDVRYGPSRVRMSARGGDADLVSDV
jgi:hypothetical protein